MSGLAVSQPLRVERACRRCGLRVLRILSLPQHQQDDAASPANVRHTVFEKQVKDAAECMQKFREMIHTLEGILSASQPATQDSEIGKLDYYREALVELTTKNKRCAWIQNVAECRLEVAAPLYLIFEMIIPVM